MKRINKAYIKNKKQKFGVNNKSKLGSYFTSILKLVLAIALFFIAAFLISGAGIIAENGALNVSNNLLVNTNTLFVDSANNRVGIGTTNPVQQVEIEGTNPVLALDLSSGSNAPSIYFTNANSIKGIVGMAGGTGSIITGSLTNDMAFRTASSQKMLWSTNNGATANMVLDSSGNVGIGTTSPANKLTVVGNISATGNLTVNGRGIFGSTKLDLQSNISLKVVGDMNLTGTLYYSALQAQSPHAFIERDELGNLKPTSFCIVTIDNNILEFGFNDLGLPVKIGLNTSDCMNKQVLIGYDITYEEVFDEETDSTKSIEKSRTEIKKYVFKN